MTDVTSYLPSFPMKLPREHVLPVLCAPEDLHRFCPFRSQKPGRGGNDRKGQGANSETVLCRRRMKSDNPHMLKLSRPLTRREVLSHVLCPARTNWDPRVTLVPKSCHSARLSSSVGAF